MTQEEHFIHSSNMLPPHPMHALAGPIFQGRRETFILQHQTRHDPGDQGIS